MEENRAVFSLTAPAADQTFRFGPLPDQIGDAWVAAAPEAPCVILWHGGFWRAEYDRMHLAPLAHALRDAGFTVVLPEYRRTGAVGERQGGWPGTFEDAALASDLLPGLLHDAGLGDGTVIHAGHSAGGHLAVWNARRHALPVDSRWRRGEDLRIRGVVALAPVLDLAEAHRLDLDGGAVEALLGGSPEAYPDRYAQTDPMRIGGPGARMTILHGDRDGRVPIAQSRFFAAQGFGTLRELPGADHFAVIDPESTAFPEVVRALRGMAALDHRTPPEDRP